MRARVLCADPVQGLGDGCRGCCCVLPRVQCHHLGHQRGGCQPVHTAAGPDNTAQCARHKGPQPDPLRAREHQPFYAGEASVGIVVIVSRTGH